MNENAISIPAEWAKQKAIWTAWPADPGEWNNDLAPPRRDVAALVHALGPENSVRVLVNGEEAAASAKEAVGSVAKLVAANYGDIWLRDTGPIFSKRHDKHLALRFQTNGWGEKFDLPGDATVGDEIAEYANTPIQRYNFVLEGGALDHDGSGTFLTTRQTLLNPNRNGWTRAQAEAALADALGAQKIIWIDEGLVGDHTDGHIDNIARFVAPGHVVCQAPEGGDDPNKDVLEQIASTLEKSSDKSGRKLTVTRIPGVGLYKNEIGETSPASHMNFVIANGVVVMPGYATKTQNAARDALQDVFPNRRVIAVPSRGLLGYGTAGGGSFHCITQQEPWL
ncbi:MAG: agmatine deiminase family protein [Hyphomicrobiaceae bacterium]